MNSPAEVGYREQIRDLRLPPAALTVWGVRILDTADLHRITADPPTGYTHKYLQKSLLQWHNPQAGGVAVLLHDQDESIPGLGDTPMPVGVFELLSRNDSSYSVGETPARFGKFPATLARNLGFRVLSHSNLITAIQIPGIRDYETAYATVNGQPPAITVDETHAGMIKGQEFIDMVSAGEWPYDIHFFDSHAPGFVIGGQEYAAAIQGMTRYIRPDSPDWEIDFIGGSIDRFADSFRQCNTSRTRVTRYSQSGYTKHLYQDMLPPDSTYPQNRAIMRRFNSVVADFLGITLPESELPDRPIPV